MPASTRIFLTEFQSCRLVVKSAFVFSFEHIKSITKSHPKCLPQPIRFSMRPWEDSLLNIAFAHFVER